jgi:hypothetical protein
MLWNVGIQQNATQKTFQNPKVKPPKKPAPTISILSNNPKSKQETKKLKLEELLQPSFSEETSTAINPQNCKSMVGGGTGLSISLKKCEQRILYKRTPDSPSRENKAALKGSTVKTLYIFSLSFAIACARRSLMVIDSNQAQDFANLCSIFSIRLRIKGPIFTITATN